MAKVPFTIQMAANMKVNGLITSNMVTVFLLSKMELNMMARLKKTG